MSGFDPIDDDRDLLAGEHALGVLEGEDLARAEHLMTSDPAFAQEVEAWRERLNPLAALVPPVQPPADLWQRIEASTALPPQNERPTRIAPVLTAGPRPVSQRDPASQRGNVVPMPRVRWWQAATGASLALAASLAAFMLLRPIAPPPEAPRVAVLAPISGGTPVLLATLGPNGALTIRPSGAIPVPSGRDLELWALAANETRPRSLGVLPAEGRRLAASLATGTQLLVSLEPRGGSPTGQPTGPVLYGGAIVVAE